MDKSNPESKSQNETTIETHIPPKVESLEEAVDIVSIDPPEATSGSGVNSTEQSAKGTISSEEMKTSAKQLKRDRDLLKFRTNSPLTKSHNKRVKKAEGSLGRNVPDIVAKTTPVDKPVESIPVEANNSTQDITRQSDLQRSGRLPVVIGKPKIKNEPDTQTLVISEPLSSDQLGTETRTKPLMTIMPVTPESRNDTTTKRLREMKLGRIAKHFENLISDTSTSELSFEERFAKLVDMVWLSFNENRIKGYIRKAEYPEPEAKIADIDYRPDRGLDKKHIEELGKCKYISEHRNIILLGNVGTGKSFISNALGLAANHDSFETRYVRLSDMLTNIQTDTELLKKLKEVPLLIIDDWLLSPISDDDSVMLADIIKTRYHKASTIICSQFAIEDWHSRIGNSTCADSIVDCIIHDAYTIEIKGTESMRKHTR